MGQSFRKSRVNIIDMSIQINEIDSLRPQGEITFRKDNDFDALFLEIKAESRHVPKIRL